MDLVHWQDFTYASIDQILHWAVAQRWARAMASCSQDTGWHSEGDV
jgi:hypothetical protein